MKEALVINPHLFMGGGGDLICFHTIHALQEANYHISLFCDSVDFPHIETMFGMRDTVRKCNHVPIFTEDSKAMPGSAPFPRFPVLDAFQRLRYLKKSTRRLAATNPEVIFHTQPSVHFVPDVETFQFVYEPDHPQIFDFYHSAYRTPNERWKLPYFAVLRMYRDSVTRGGRRKRHFLALSSFVLNRLKEKGYNNSTLILPPCRNIFRPMQKKRQVVTVARMSPEKRLEIFCQVAKRIPDCNFILVGRESPHYRAYKNMVLSEAPPNLRYVESSISLRPELLGESKVYLHAGKEHGFGIAITEGLSAGCIPVCFAGGDGAEVVKQSGVGYIYDNLNSATECVREALNANYPDPETISEKARMFSPEVFEAKIRELV